MLVILQLWAISFLAISWRRFFLCGKNENKNMSLML